MTGPDSPVPAPVSPVIDALSGLTVLEIGGRISGRFAGQLLAMCGADVVVDPAFLPANADLDPLEDAFLQSDKRDGAWKDVLAAAGGRQIVVIRSVPAGQRARFDLGAVPVVDVAPFAFEGRAKGWEGDSLILSHASGLGYVTPGGVSLDNPPLRLPRKLAERAAGVSVATAVLSLWRMAQDGHRASASVAEIESLFPMLSPIISPYTRGEGITTRDMAGPADLLSPCADGEVTFSFVQETEWQRFANLVGKPDWGEAFAGYLTRKENWHRIVEMLDDWLKARTKREIFELCQPARVPCGMVQRASDVISNEQVGSRRFIRTVDLGGSGQPIAIPGLPWNAVQGSHELREPPPRPGPAPLPSPALVAAAAGHALPLAGLRVVEFGGFWAAPRCAAILAELGAEVIKIETIKRPDLQDVITAPDGSQEVVPKPFFQVVNGNKRSVTIDLEIDAGRQLIIDLARVSDVVVENFRPGTLARFGLGFDVLQSENPRLVLVSLSGFGQSGPYRGHSAYGPIVESMSGVRSLLGYEGESRTHLAGFSYADPLSGAFGALAALAALAQVRRDGRGCHVDLSQIEGLLAVEPEVLLEYAATGIDPGPAGNREGHAPPYGLYRCAGEDRWVAIGFGADDSWDGFCGHLGLSEIIRARFATESARRRDARALDEAVANALAGRDAFEVAEALQGRGIAAAACVSIHDLVSHLDMFDAGAFAHWDAARDLTTLTYGQLIRFNGRKPTVIDPAPSFGSDNGYVLRKILGLSDERNAELAASGAIR